MVNIKVVILMMSFPSSSDKVEEEVADNNFNTHFKVEVVILVVLVGSNNNKGMNLIIATVMYLKWILEILIYYLEEMKFG